MCLLDAASLPESADLHFSYVRPIPRTDNHSGSGCLLLNDAGIVQAADDKPHFGIGVRDLLCHLGIAYESRHIELREVLGQLFEDLASNVAGSAESADSVSRWNEN